MSTNSEEKLKGHGLTRKLFKIWLCHHRLDFQPKYHFHEGNTLSFLKM